MIDINSLMNDTDVTVKMEKVRAVWNEEFKNADKMVELELFLSFSAQQACILLATGVRGELGDRPGSFSKFLATVPLMTESFSRRVINGVTKIVEGLR